MITIHKAVIRYKLITKGRRIISIDSAPCQVKYLPADAESKKALEWLIGYLHEGFVNFVKDGG